MVLHWCCSVGHCGAVGLQHGAVVWVCIGAALVLHRGSLWGCRTSVWVCTGAALVMQCGSLWGCTSAALVLQRGSLWGCRSAVWGCIGAAAWAIVGL